LRRDLLRSLFVVFALAMPALAIDSKFYTNLLDRGMSSYAAGDYVAASRMLRIASFGLLDSIPDYERALVYLAVAQQKSGLGFDAKETVAKVLEADRIQSVFASLPLDSGTRAEFNAIARGTLTEAQYALLQTPGAAPPSPIVTQPRIDPPVVSEQTTVRPPEPAPSDVPATNEATTAAELEIEMQEAEAVAAAQREALRLETERVTPAELEAMDAADAAASKTEASEAEAARIEAARVEAARVEAARVETARAEALRAEAARTQADRDTAKAAEKERAEAAQREIARLQEANRLADSERAVREAAERDRQTRELAAREEAITRELQAAAERARLDQAAVMSREESELAARINREMADRATSAVATGQLPPANGRADAALGRQLDEAERLLDAGRIADARGIYREILSRPGISRNEALRVGEGLYRTLDFADSIVAFSRLRSLGSGEEVYRFYVAASLYETGEYAAAKLQMQCALPHIKPNDDVLRYWVKIENAR